MESAVEAGAPAAAVPEDRPPPQTSGALLDETTAAANPFPCGRCRAFHNNESGYCEKCSSSWLSPGFVARARRLQRRTYLALITLVMSYFETSDRLVLSMFIGSSGLIVLFYLLTQSVATESPTWICGLVAYVAALLYLIPTIRSTVLKVEDIDKISSLFEEATKQSLAGATKDDLRPAPRKLADKLLQPTDDLRQLYRRLHGIWWRRQYRELQKLFFSPPSKCPIDLFGPVSNRTALKQLAYRFLDPKKPD